MQLWPMYIFCGENLIGIYVDDILLATITLQEKQWMKANRVLRYLKGTSTLGLSFRHGKKVQLITWFSRLTSEFQLEAEDWDQVLGLIQFGLNNYKSDRLLGRSPRQAFLSLVPSWWFLYYLYRVYATSFKFKNPYIKITKKIN